MLADAYPYTAYSTGLSTVLFENWALDGGTPALLGRLRDSDARARIRKEADARVPEEPGGYDLIVISDVRGEQNRALIGKNLLEIAALWKLEPVDALLRLIEEEKGSVGYIGHGMSPENVELVLAHPLVMIGSDGYSMAPEAGRADAPAPALLRRLCARARPLLPRAEALRPRRQAVRKMTSMPADQVGIRDRGRIAKGMKADIVLFDAAAVRDEATFDDSAPLRRGHPPRAGERRRRRRERPAYRGATGAHAAPRLSRIAPLMRRRLLLGALLAACPLGCGGGPAQQADDPAGPSSVPAGRYFPDGAWYRDVSAAPVDAESTTVVAFLAREGFGTGEIRVDFSLEVLEAGSDAPLRSFTPTDDFFSPDCDLMPVPVPAGGALEGERGYACDSDGDCHLIVVHRPARKLYEMWRADIRGDQFHGGCLAVWDMARVYGPSGRGEQCTSADAAGYPIAPLLFSADEVAAGQIAHAIRFVLPNSRIRRGEYVHPATHGTPATSGPRQAPPYGDALAPARRLPGGLAAERRRASGGAGATALRHAARRRRPDRADGAERSLHARQVGRRCSARGTWPRSVRATSR